jgi:hypothetical protein
MTYTVALLVHIAAGVAGVLLGPPVLYFAAVRGVTRLAGAYHASVLLVCVSAAVLAALDFADLWWFLLVAAGSYAFAARAVIAARQRRPNWLPRYIRGHGGAYIALWTAVVVVSINHLPVVWLIPTAVGAPLVEWLAHRAHTPIETEAARLPAKQVTDSM